MDVRMPDGTIIQNVPDGTTQTELLSRYQKSKPQSAEPEVARPEANILGMNVSGETDSGFNPAAAIISAGRLGDKLNQGYQQAKMLGNYAVQRLLPFGDRGQSTLDALEQQRQEQADADKRFAALQDIHPGSTQIGQIVPMLPLGPGAMLAAAATEYGTPAERAARVGATVVGNKLAQVAGNVVGGRVQELAAQKATNAVRDANIEAAKVAGYKALPSEAGGSLTGRLMEGASGQIKAKQAAQVANQPITDALAKAEANIPDAADLTYAALKQGRDAAYQAGYEPLKVLWGDKVRLKPSASFVADVSSITSRADKASASFGDAVKSDVSGLVDQVKAAKPFTADEALSAISVWREKASDAYRAGNTDMGRAYRKLATSLEDELGRHLEKSGNEALLTGYQEARKAIAKNFDVQAALVEGQGVNAQKIAQMYRKNPERFSGGLKTIAQAGSSLKDSTKLPVQGGTLPISALDTWGSAMGGLGATAASIASGNIAPLFVPPAVVAARVGARRGLLTDAGQRMFANPDYSPGLLLRGEQYLLDNPYAPQVGGLLGYYAANR